MSISCSSFVSKEETLSHRTCLASVKDQREPLSPRRLRDPMNEVILKLRMEGTMISSEEELHELLMRVNIGWMQPGFCVRA